MMDGVHFQHLQLRGLAFFHRIGRVLQIRNAELRHRDEALDVVPQIHHDSLVHEAQHTTPQLGADRVRLTDPEPGVLLRLLQAERDPLVLGVTFRIRTSTSSPFFTTSEGCCTRLVHDMSEMWIRPSMPGSISTNAPNDVRLRTLPRMRVPTGYFCGSAIQGSSSVCFMPREIFSSVSSTLRTTASMVSPMDTILEGWRTLRVQLISEMCTRPSMPSSSSTNAP